MHSPGGHHRASGLQGLLFWSGSVDLVVTVQAVVRSVQRRVSRQVRGMDDGPMDLSSHHGRRSKPRCQAARGRAASEGQARTHKRSAVLGAPGSPRGESPAAAVACRRVPVEPSAPNTSTNPVPPNLHHSRMRQWLRRWRALAAALHGSPLYLPPQTPCDSSWPDGSTPRSGAPAALIRRADSATHITAIACPLPTGEHGYSGTSRRRRLCSGLQADRSAFGRRVVLGDRPAVGGPTIWTRDECRGHSRAGVHGPPHRHRRTSSGALRNVQAPASTFSASPGARDHIRRRLRNGSHVRRLVRSAVSAGGGLSLAR